MLVVLVYDDIGEWCLFAGIASLVSVLSCWHCYIDEWSLHVRIVSLLSVPRCWYCYTDVSYIGIAILVSVPYMFALLYW